MDNQFKVPGRAYTVEEKKVILHRLFLCWEQADDQRLGQLIINSFGLFCPEIFFSEDETLVKKIEAFIEPKTKSLSLDLSLLEDNDPIPLINRKINK